MSATTIFILNFIAFNFNAFADWQSSIPESVIKRISEDRYIFVRVDDQEKPTDKAANKTNDKSSDKPNDKPTTKPTEKLPEQSVGKTSLRRLQIGGLMQVAASQSTGFDYIKNYANLKKISSVIKTADYNPKTGELLFVCEAFKYRATMQIKMLENPADAKKDYSEISFKVVEGTMKGYEGKIIVRSEPKMQSKIEFDSQFDYLTLPIPKLFVEFGFGIVFQKIAERIRAGIEEEKAKKGSLN